MSDTSNHTTACHEGAHACCAILFGLNPGEVSIDDRRTYGGKCQIGGAHCWADLALVSVVGLVCEHWLCPSRHDHQGAQEDFCHLAQLICQYILRMPAPQLRACVSRMWEDLQTEAERLMEEGGPVDPSAPRHIEFTGLLVRIAKQMIASDGFSQAAQEVAKAVTEQQPGARGIRRLEGNEVRALVRRSLRFGSLKEPDNGIAPEDLSRLRDFQDQYR